MDIFFLAEIILLLTSLLFYCGLFNQLFDQLLTVFQYNNRSSALDQRKRSRTLEAVAGPYDVETASIVSLGNESCLGSHLGTW